MKAIQFNTIEELQEFNNKEAKERNQDIGMTTKYTWAWVDLLLLVGDDLPQHTSEYELTEYEPPQIEEEII